MRNLGVVLAAVAGLIGGIFSHLVWPQSAVAQTAAQRLVAAQNFMLVDARGNPVGIFTVANPSPQTGNAPSIVLYNAQGREIWRASDSAKPLMTGR